MSTILPTTGAPLPADWLQQAQSLIEPVPDASMLEQFQQLYGLMIAGNERCNLTRITDPSGYWYRHVLESLWLTRWLPSTPGSWVCDVGSGAGFPLFPLAIGAPQHRYVALESLQKKATYLSETASTLGLDHVTIVADRAETLGQRPEYRQQFDVVTARAVANLSTLAELCSPLLKVGGLMLALKGTKWREEVEAARKAFHQLHVSLEETIDWQSPIHEAPVTLLVIRKKGGTPATYPRLPGTPAKQPL